MTYGIEIKGGGDVLQIASNRIMSGFKISSLGAGSTIPGTTANVFEPKLILVKPSTPASGAKQEVYIDKRTTEWSVVDQTGASISVNYVIIESFKNSNNTPTTGTYGIQIFDSSGDLAFDSAAVGTDGVTLTSTADAASYSGDYLVDPAIITDLTQYVLIDSSFYTRSGNSGSEMGFIYANNYTIGSNTRNGIYFTGKFYFQIFEQLGSSYLPNPSQILTAKIGSV